MCEQMKEYTCEKRELPTKSVPPPRNLPFSEASGAHGGGFSLAVTETCGVA